MDLNPLNAELNPICHLLALLGGETIVVVSRLRVKRVIVWTVFRISVTGFRSRLGDHRKGIFIRQEVYFLSSRVTTIS
jgi:hypothetical protein